MVHLDQVGGVVVVADGMVRVQVTLTEEELAAMERAVRSFWAYRPGQHHGSRSSIVAAFAIRGLRAVEGEARAREAAQREKEGPAAGSEE